MQSQAVLYRLLVLAKDDAKHLETAMTMLRDEPSLATTGCGPDKWMPLHVACNMGSLELVRRLLQFESIDVNVRTPTHNMTPLHIACYIGHTAVVDALLRHGADMAMRDAESRTALHLASLRGHIETCRALVAHDSSCVHAVLQTEPLTNWTALHIAARHGYLEREFRTALHMAVAFGHTPVVGLLLSHRVDVALADTNDETALHLAARHGAEEIGTLLVTHGAALDARNVDGDTPLDVARKCGHTAFCLKLQRRSGSQSSQHEQPPPPSRCETYKLRGNEFYQANDMSKAHKMFSKAIALALQTNYGNTEQLAIFYSNRAACDLKMQNYNAVISDCTAALKLSPKHAKSYCRRGEAYENLGQLEQARIDLRRAVGIDPHFQDALTKLAALDELIAQRWKTASTASVTTVASSINDDAEDFKALSPRTEDQLHEALSQLIVAHGPRVAMPSEASSLTSSGRFPASDTHPISPSNSRTARPPASTFTLSVPNVSSASTPPSSSSSHTTTTITTTTTATSSAPSTVTTTPTTTTTTTTTTTIPTVVIDKSHTQQTQQQPQTKRRESVLAIPRKSLEERIRQRVIGQSIAVSHLCAAIQMRDAGWQADDSPLVFMFMGPSGVGKTELAKALAAGIAPATGASPHSLIRCDMSEFQHQHDVAKLIGAPPGYVGHESGGVLTEGLKKCSDAVVLLDEVEKAHTEVLTALLALFDEGRITDGKGETVIAQNAIFIMTSTSGPRRSSQTRTFCAPPTARPSSAPS